MQYMTLKPLKIETDSRTVTLKQGQRVKLPEGIGARFVTEGKVIPYITTWLDKLSDAERDIFQEQTAAMPYNDELPRERAEVEAIKQILQERIIPGKCDWCNHVNTCMMTPGQRELCEVVNP